MGKGEGKWGMGKGRKGGREGGIFKGGLISWKRASSMYGREGRRNLKKGVRLFCLVEKRMPSFAQHERMDEREGCLPYLTLLLTLLTYLTYRNGMID